MSWDTIEGHESIVTAFRNAARRQRLGQAYLFVGPEGVGKHLFAGELAKTLLCENLDETFTACGRCSSCHLVSVDTHPDLIRVARDEDKINLTIGRMRELLGRLGLKAARNGRKVVIIDDVDDFNTEAANSFLKALEEPAALTTFVLIGGGSIETQLETIVSRCQVIRFAPLSPALLGDMLQRAGVADGVKRDRLIRLSGGSIGRALALRDDSLGEFRTTLLQGLAEVSPDFVRLAADWSKFVGDAGKEASKKRRRATMVIRLLLEMLESALRFSLPDATFDEDPSPEQETLRGLGERLGTETLIACLDRCLEAGVHVDRLVQLDVVLEALMDALGQKWRGG